MTLSERLLERKAAAAIEHIGAGGDAESFEKLWQRIESLELASIAMNPEGEQDIRRMSMAEKVALRESIGDAEFTRRIQEGGR
ncbi:MAG: hypothetical protein GXY07_01620 [Candidatus Hydrogenedentes bacterium]|nr:hypothetical protein [Candidatus Hydrogenedentota bacterium]